VPGGGVVFNEQQQAMFDQQKGMCASQVAQQVQVESQRVESTYGDKGAQLAAVQQRLQQAVADMKKRVEKNNVIAEKEAALDKMQEGMASQADELQKMKTARQAAAANGGTVCHACLGKHRAHTCGKSGTSSYMARKAAEGLCGRTQADELMQSLTCYLELAGGTRELLRGWTCQPGAPAPPNKPKRVADHKYVDPLGHMYGSRLEVARALGVVPGAEDEGASSTVAPYEAGEDDYDDEDDYEDDEDDDERGAATRRYGGDEEADDVEEGSDDGVEA